MSHETAKCCKKCEFLTETGACTQYGNCSKWRRWFHKEWEKIRKDFGVYKAKKETEVPK